MSALPGRGPRAAVTMRDELGRALLGLGGSGGRAPRLGPLLIPAPRPGPVGRFLRLLEHLGGHEEQRAGQIQRRPEEEDEEPAKPRHVLYGSTRPESARGLALDCRDTKPGPARARQLRRGVGTIQAAMACRSQWLRPMQAGWLVRVRGTGSPSSWIGPAAACLLL